jgi:hypothetical protein
MGKAGKVVWLLFEAEPRKMRPTTRVARFYLIQYTKKGENIANDHNVYQMAINYTK